MFKRNAMFTRSSMGQAIVLTAILAVIAPASFARDRASSTRTKAAPASISQKQAASTNTKAARPKAARRVKEAQRFERLADRQELLQRTLPKAGAHVFDASARSPRLGDAAPTRKSPGDLARKRYRAIDRQLHSQAAQLRTLAPRLGAASVVWKASESDPHRSADEAQIRRRRYVALEADVDSVIEDLRSSVDENREMVKKAIQVMLENAEMATQASGRLAQ